MRRDAGTFPWQAFTFLPSMLIEHVAQSPCLQLYLTFKQAAERQPGARRVDKKDATRGSGSGWESIAAIDSTVVS